MPAVSILFLPDFQMFTQGVMLREHTCFSKYLLYRKHVLWLDTGGGNYLRQIKKCFRLIYQMVLCCVNLTIQNEKFCQEKGAELTLKYIKGLQEKQSKPEKSDTSTLLISNYTLYLIANRFNKFEWELLFNSVPKQSKLSKWQYSDWQGQQGVGAAFTWHHYQKIRGDVGELLSIVLLSSKFVNGTVQIELKMGLKKVNN